uniref:Uncharacterized protein n=1 Tax=Rhizophora mucronata TaxID=61149 RepID=A0A2P2JSN9_RHIMU
MAATANAFSLSPYTAPYPTLKPKAFSDIYVRFPDPKSISLRLNRVGISAESPIRMSSSRVRASTAPVMDQSVSPASSKEPTIVDVDLGNRSYPIYIGSGLLDQPELLQRCFALVLHICSISHNFGQKPGVVGQGMERASTALK